MLILTQMEILELHLRSGAAGTVQIFCKLFSDPLELRLQQKPVPLRCSCVDVSSPSRARKHFITRFITKEFREVIAS